MNPEFLPIHTSDEEEKKYFKENPHLKEVIEGIKEELLVSNRALDKESEQIDIKVAKLEGKVLLKENSIEQSIEQNKEHIEKIENELINVYGHDENNLDQKLTFAERKDNPLDRSFIERYNKIHYERSQLLDSNKKLKDKILLNKHPLEN